MHLEDVAPRLVQPRDDDQFVTRLNAEQRVRGPRRDLQPHIRRALGALLRRVAPRREPGRNRADEAERRGVFRHRLRSHASRAAFLLTPRLTTRP
jgi:hypothetical protein